MTVPTVDQFQLLPPERPADDVRADRAQKAILGARLEIRPGNGDVYALTQRQPSARRHVARQRTQRQVVGL